MALSSPERCFFICSILLGGALLRDTVLRGSPNVVSDAGFLRHRQHKVRRGWRSPLAGAARSSNRAFWKADKGANSTANRISCRRASICRVEPKKYEKEGVWYAGRGKLGETISVFTLLAHHTLAFVPRSWNLGIASEIYYSYIKVFCFLFVWRVSPYIINVNVNININSLRYNFCCFSMQSFLGGGGGAWHRVTKKHLPVLPHKEALDTLGCRLRCFVIINLLLTGWKRKDKVEWIWWYEYFGFPRVNAFIDLVHLLSLKMKAAPELVSFHPKRFTDLGKMKVDASFIPIQYWIVPILH